MSPRYTRALAAVVAAGAVAVPAVAHANGGRDDPPNHEQRAHQVVNHSERDRVDHDRSGRHDRIDNDRRDRQDRVDRDRHDRIDDDRGDGRGSDDGPNHR